MKNEISEILENYVTNGYRSEKGIYDTDIDDLADELCKYIEVREQVLIKRAWQDGYSAGAIIMNGEINLTPNTPFDYYLKLNEELKNATKR